jgi:hypothetical protein
MAKSEAEVKMDIELKPKAQPVQPSSTGNRSANFLPSPEGWCGWDNNSGKQFFVHVSGLRIEDDGKGSCDIMLPTGLRAAVLNKTAMEVFNEFQKGK